MQQVFSSFIVLHRFLVHSACTADVMHAGLVACAVAAVCAAAVSAQPAAPRGVVLMMMGALRVALGGGRLLVRRVEIGLLPVCESCVCEKERECVCVCVCVCVDRCVCACVYTVDARRTE